MGAEGGFHSFNNAQTRVQKCHLLESQNVGQGLRAPEVTGTTKAANDTVSVSVQDAVV